MVLKSCKILFGHSSTPQGYEKIYNRFSDLQNIHAKFQYERLSWLIGDQHHDKSILYIRLTYRQLSISFVTYSELTALSTPLEVFTECNNTMEAKPSKLRNNTKKHTSLQISIVQSVNMKNTYISIQNYLLNFRTDIT